jgi:hypothetical protein
MSSWKTKAGRDWFDSSTPWQIGEMGRDALGYTTSSTLLIDAAISPWCIVRNAEDIVGSGSWTSVRFVEQKDVYAPPKSMQ